MSSVLSTFQIHSRPMSEEEELIICDNINIRPWSLTLGATSCLNLVTVRSLTYVLDFVINQIIKCLYLCLCSFNPFHRL